jgi:hypothetical protein
LIYSDIRVNLQVFHALGVDLVISYFDIASLAYYFEILKAPLDGKERRDSHLFDCQGVDLNFD